MRTLLLSFTLLFAFSSVKAQTIAGITKAEQDAFEEFCPFYIIENYCNPQGYHEINRRLLADERAYGFRKFADTFSGQASDSLLYFRFKRSLIRIECSETVNKLTGFVVELPTEKEVLEFGNTYAALMGFKLDPKDDKKKIRYFSEASPMNAVLVSRIPNSDPKYSVPFHAVCFVFQSGFCD